MRKLFHTRLPFALAIGIFILINTSCLKDKCTETITFQARIPIYVTGTEMDALVKSLPARDLKNPGKIFQWNDYLLINEYLEGVHIVENSNPASPQKVSFLNIPGNIDLFVKDNILYADNYTDLLALDLNDPSNVRLMARIPKVLNYNQDFITSLYKPDVSKGMIVGYTIEEITDKRPCNSADAMPLIAVESAPVTQALTQNTFSTSASSSSSAGARGNGSGAAGSMSKFTIKSNYLYVLNHEQLKIFDVANSASPFFIRETNVGPDVETIFPYNNNLFIGSQTGMMIYDISNPISPNKLSTYAHVRQCDPVVVKDDYAYVTLRTGTECAGAVNELHILDVSNLSDPKLKWSYRFDNPRGLGIFADALFLCDGNAGLKVFDLNHKENLKTFQLNQFSGFETFDVIPQRESIMVIGPDGLYQYKYNSTYDMTHLSTLPVVK